MSLNMAKRLNPTHGTSSWLAFLVDTEMSLLIYRDVQQCQSHHSLEEEREGLFAQTSASSHPEPALHESRTAMRQNEQYNYSDGVHRRCVVPHLQSGPLLTLQTDFKMILSH